MLKLRKNHMKQVSFVLVLTLLLTAGILPAPKVFAAAIGVTDNGSYVVVNTGAGLIYTINKANGDMTSCKMNGTELTGTKPSHINSGLGTATVTWGKSPSGATVLITVSTDTLTHYYVSRAGQNIIYMATYISAEPSIGCLRYIFRGKGSVLTNVPVESNIRGASGLEGGPDVFAFSNGKTASKYYGNDQAKDMTIKGCTGNGVGVFMAYGSRETCIGGPFFRDIQFQSGTDTEIYNVMNHAEGQTEEFRMGLYGPYAYVFTDGSTPEIPDFSWMSGLNLKGWVSSRGAFAIVGLSGMDSNYKYTYGFANSTAQYWADASSSGFAKCTNMKPGTYTMTVYKGELSVYTEQVTITANQTTMLHTRTISNDPANTSAIWRIGKWDGTPLEFLNGSNISIMHPSDVRNASWGPVTYTVGSSSTGQFPAVQFRGANSPTTIKFSMNSSQAAAAHTLNIGITTAYNNGRPSVTINGHTLSLKSASSQPKSRTLTVGTYRGNNAVFSWSVPASYFVNGTNTITITPISGNSDLGTYLSASYAYDCVELAN
ncbi:rhamnogalacturonan lyase B N-terminal domain-containing protein [Anaeromicropila populeti]|uniref:rhamnogalacturonan endolyase n=1 Tax=Anaeromicropila populeti TaxID=37658 RepID=A0A1I6LJL1_9FIRM|nr:rhamnogalacturonan lyase B N-terminal domain-containing protein [Anaeromicropila populeti]SFS03480.1 rhamnogalacturonan endolyase [Anaeromicropila populeti]